MKKAYTIICHLCLYAMLALSACSCTQDESFSFRGASGISFERASYRLAMGSLPYSVADTVIRIPLTAVGSASTSPRSYRLKVIDTVTTAKAGVHFQPFSTERILPAGATSDTLRINILRRNLNEDSLYVLTVGISEKTELPPIIAELSKMQLVFDNRLDMPTWWPELAYWLGEYDKKKYQKFIEWNGSPVTQKEMNERKYEYLRIFKKVKAYFEAHPQEGVNFPDVHWEV